MQLKTIFNKCCKFKSFIVACARFNEKEDSIILSIERRANSKPECGCFQSAAPGYNIPKYRCRLFEFIPFWGFRVYLKEPFQKFWKYRSLAWAGKYLDAWCKKTMYSKMEPIKNIAKCCVRTGS